MDQPSTAPTMISLQERRDFLRVRKGSRARFSSLIVEARPTPAEDAQPDTIRIGFTCTKRLGNAVRRNRTKRRLRAAARDVLSRMGKAGTDYVIIGKIETADLPFEQLIGDLEKAVTKVHAPRQNIKSNTRKKTPQTANK
ncbi:MAG: ribonuclease P protein component [Alphaproteobacteria bacterium]